METCWMRFRRYRVRSQITLEEKHSCQAHARAKRSSTCHTTKARVPHINNMHGLPLQLAPGFYFNEAAIKRHTPMVSLTPSRPWPLGHSLQSTARSRLHVSGRALRSFAEEFRRSGCTGRAVRHDGHRFAESFHGS